MKLYAISRRLIRARSPAFVAFFHFIAVPARWRPETSLALSTIAPSHCLSALASFLGYYQVPRAAARHLAADGGRQSCGCCFFRYDLRRTAPSGNAAGAGHEVGTIGRDAAGSVGGAGAPSTSAGRAGAARASCTSGSACWGGGGIDGRTSTLVGTARGTDAEAGW